MIVELLIIGFQVLLWVGLLFWALSDGKDACTQSLKELDRWIPVLGVGTFAAAYTLGLLFDRLIGNLSALVQAKLLPNRSKDVSDQGASILLQHHDAWAYIESVNRQIRLLRATCFNSLLTMFVVLVWYKPCWIIPWLLLAVFVASSVTWPMSSRRLDLGRKTLQQELETLHKQDAEASTDNGGRACRTAVSDDTHNVERPNE
ncbi:MAG: hypothetical protein JW993_03800 [Sedimentisphaerales bacterium]|nr:hypothetical protein [Sedimentisphaerales bacterium]